MKNIFLFLFVTNNLLSAYDVPPTSIKFGQEIYKSKSKISKRIIPYNPALHPRTTTECCIKESGGDLAIL